MTGITKSLSLYFVITIVTAGSTGGENLYVNVGENEILECNEAKLQPDLLQVEWFCRSCASFGSAKDTLVAMYSPETGAKTLIQQSRIKLQPPLYSLYVTNMKTGDTGTWYCKVDGQNKPVTSYHLKVTDVPSTPGKPLVMSFSSRTVKLSWAPPLNTHNSPIKEYYVRVRQGEDSDWSDTKVVPTSSNATVFSVNSLHPFTVYSFKVSAINGVGQSVESDESYYMITLREKPSGKPTITTAYNTSSDSIYLSWEPPQLTTIHGEFLGYQLSFQTRDSESSNTTNITIKGPNASDYTLKNLNVFTQYLISLTVKNPEGFGPATTVAVMTDEGVPSAPQNVTSHSITNNSVIVNWEQPNRPNGIIEGYRLYFMHANFTDVKTIKKTSTPTMEYKLLNLEPYMNYRLWLKAFTQKHEGSPSKQLSLTTDVAGPPSPVITNLTCEDDKTLYIEWANPIKNEKSNRISHFSLFFSYTGERQVSVKHLTVENVTENLFMVQLENLTSNQLYSVRVQGNSESIYNPGLIYSGQISDTHQILLQKDCHLVQAITIGHSRKMALNLNAGVVAGLGATVLLFALGLLFTALWRRYFTESYYYLEAERVGLTDTKACTVPDWDLESSEKEKTSVPADLFLQHVSTLHRNEDEIFSREFEKMNLSSPEKKYNIIIASHPANQDKNRYNNVLPYDHSLVQLRPLPGQKRADYLNASYIDGFQRSKAYIGTQGPLTKTTPSFWRMVWDHKVRVIIMITNLVEQGKKKCDQYWPESGNELFGIIDVLLLREDVQANHTVRTFRLCNLKLNKKDKIASVRDVMQYQYTSWPDHGTPVDVLPVLTFIKKSSNACVADSGTSSPVVVHCSAGVGRTGTYIVIDAMLKQLKAKGEVNIPSFLKHIRHQRGFLVQTEEQYIFIHDVLAEVVASGETIVKCSYLARYIKSLQSNFTTEDSTWQLLQRQYNQITSKKPLEHQFSTATMPNNQLKNQSFDFLPINSSRVKLPVLSEIEGSDYINASWIPGFQSLSEFILSQHPNEQTTHDFWRLIWDQDIHTIVVLSSVCDPVFWPDDEQVRVKNLSVKHTEEGLLSGFQTKDFRLESDESTPRVVRMVFCPNWASTHVYASEEESSYLTLLPVINARMDNLPPRPLLVIDKEGGTKAATFCALSTLIRQLDYDHSVDIYTTAKSIHNSRPGVWLQPENILFLYKAIEGYVFIQNNKNFKSLPLRISPEGTDETTLISEVDCSKETLHF